MSRVVLATFAYLVVAAGFVAAVVAARSGGASW